MATTSNFDKRSYTWWWNSHISPKNSKWLQENLSDMDSKVKQMIKVIEEDADSFARRAEMYYKRRPELLKLVEEFYRAYRALAEKYDNATGVIRQAHRTMAEAFPDHVPSLLGDDALAGDVASEGGPRTPETMHPTHALFDPEEVLKDNAGLRHFHMKKTGAFTDEPGSLASKKGLKQFNEFGSREAEPGRAKFGEGRARKELNFHEGEEKDKIVGGGVLPKSEQVIRLEEDMKLLKESLAKVEAEKEADLLKYQQSLERLSNLESETVRAKEDARHLNECASKAEIEVLTLKETLANFNIEKEASLLKYEQCLERISNLDKNLSCAQEDAGELNRRTREAETEAQTLKEELTLVKSEKEAIFVQNKQSLEVISHLENDLICAEENARIISEKADAAAKEIEKLKKDITRLTEENEALALQYQHCLVIISNLESKIASAEEEIQRLNGEIDVGLAKLRGAEDRCLSLERSNQSLQAEKELLELKVGSQDQELIDKQQELARLWSCIQEERLRFVEAETAFQTLQHLHSQSQEELKSLVSELQMKGQVLEDLEIRNRVLQDDVRKTEEENKSLSVINLSSSASMKDMENELSDLKETIAKLQEEVDLRVDQRNALQQEIYCLKEELNELNKKQSFIVEQVESVGLNPECIASRVKELQNDNLKLNDVFQREKSEKEALLGKLEIMEKLLEKNAVLENSLADLNAELDGVREKVKSLEESCEMLMAEKSTLSSEKETLFVQLEMITENSHRLSEKSSLLESSLFDVNRELEGLRDKSNSLEHALQLVDREKDVLTTEKESLSSQLEIAQQRLEDSENRWKELEGKSNDLETERESLLCTVEELRRSLDVEKQEHARVLELCEVKVTTLESSLSDVNAELEVVTEKSQSIENSVQLLKHQKEGLIVERESLSSQLEITRESLEESKRSIKDLEVKSNDLRKEKELSLSTIEELRGSLDTEKREHASILELHEAKFATLESSLRDVNCELEGLREKTKNLEHSLQVVHGEKAGLIIEKGSLSSQLESTQQKMEDFEKRCEELEGETNDLSKEKELLLCTIEELRGSLGTEKREHASILELHKAKFATLESSLQDVNCELEGLREKTQNLEHSLQVVHGEKDGLIIEKGSLSLQLETTQQKMEDFEKRCEELEGETNDLNKEKELLLCTIEELRGSLDTEKREHASILELHKAKFATLESSLRDVNCELEGLREKTQNLEHSLQVVHGEKAGLIIEKGSLSSQLEMTHQKMEDFKKRCEELEGETNDLEKEKQSLLGTVEELRSSLDVEKQDHASVLELYGTGLASLQSQILLLQEEGWHGKKKYEEELDKTIRANIEIFILQKGLQEMEGKCFTQSVECQRLVKTSEQLELSVCQLEHQNLKQEVEAKALLDQLKNVRMVMYQVALAFDIDVDTWDDDEILRDQMYLKKILDNLEDLRKSLKTALEENWQLMAEKSVLSTLLSQFRLEATELESIRSSLCEHLNVTTQKLLAVQSENHRILEMNEGLRQVVVEGEKKEEFSRNEIDSLLANLLKLQGAHQILQRQNSEVIEEKKSLMKEVLNLVKEKNSLADESILLLHETLFLSNLSLVFENFISEKSLAMQELGETVDRLCRVRNVLEMDVKVMVGKLDMTNAENLHLKDSLEKSEAELETVRLLSDQLKFDLVNSNTLLTQKEMELSEAEKKLESAQSEKLEFQKALGDLAMEYEQLKVIKGNQEECISKLSEESERRRMETESLSEVISNLEAEMSVICRKHEETKISEQTLNSELEKGRNEFKLWENDAALLFTRLHISNVHEALFTDMAYELSKKCVILENSENSKAEEIYLLKEKVGSLEDKNGVLEAQIVSYVAGIESLKDCLNSLESHTLLQDKLQKAVDEEAKGVQSSGHVDADCEQTDNFDAKFPDGVSGLLDLQSRIVAIEKAVDNLEKLQIKDLQSQIHSRDDFLSTGRYGSSRQDDGELPKDIILDQISECSPLGVSKREAVEVNDPGLELWEATDASIDQAKKQEICTDEIPSSEVVFEKELCVIDKSEISKRFKDHSQNQEGSKMKILERLDSDSQKLTNLQIIVQDLKAKVEITEKSKKGKGIEYDTVREQLEEAEETIMKLFDMNSKLKKNIEEFCSDDGKSGRSFDDTEGNRSKRVSEHARRGSEKIGRLQLEVQKLQFLLLKFDGRKESQGKTSMIERSPRVVLRDYLYGTKTTHNHKQKKTRFCSCVRPPTKGD